MPYERRGAALDEAIAELRARCPDGPPIWIASWGRALRRVARSGDGWVASAFHCTPAAFAEQWLACSSSSRTRAAIPTRSPNIVATLFYVGADAERVVAERFSRR